MATTLIGLQKISFENAAGKRIAVKGLTQKRIHRSASQILNKTTLCSIATVASSARVHINSAFFAFSADLQLFFLSHPDSLHCRNLTNNPSMAITVFASDQRWGAPGCGLQLFGRCREAKGPHAGNAERIYVNRFPHYKKWKASTPAGSISGEYRFYRFVVSSFKLLDEGEFGDGVFVRAMLTRRPGSSR